MKEEELNIKTNSNKPEILHKVIEQAANKAKIKTNTIEEAKKFMADVNPEVLTAWNGVYEIMVAYADQYSTPQEGRGRYVTEFSEIETELAELEDLLSDVEIGETIAFIRTRLCTLFDQIFTSAPEMEREWISVDEEPKEGGLYNVYFEHEHDSGVSAYTYSLNKGWEWSGVKFWQPLPSPPRSDGDKKDEV